MKMRRAIRWFLYGLLGLFTALALAVLVVLIALQTDWGRNVVRVQIVERVNQRLNGTLHIDRIASNVLTSADLRGVTLLDRDRRPVVRADRVDIHYSLLDLVTGDLRFSTLRLVAPTVELELFPDGTNSFTRLVRESKEEPASPEQGGTAFELGQILVERGSLRIVRHTADGTSEYRADDIDADLGVRIRNQETRVSLRRLRAWSPAYQARVNANGEFARAPGLIQVPEMHLALGEARLDVARLSFSETATTSGSFAAALPARFLQKWASPVIVTPVRWTGTVERQTVDAPWQLDSQIETAGGGAALDARFEPTAGAARARVHLRALDLSRIVRGALPTAISGDITANASGFDRGKQMTGRLSSNLEGRVGKHRIDELALTGSARGGTVELQATMRSRIASLDARLRAQIDRTPIMVDDAHVMAATDLATLQEFFPKQKPLGGHLRLAATAHGPLDRLALTGTVSGNALQNARAGIAKLRGTWLVTDFGPRFKGETTLELEGVFLGSRRIGPVETRVVLGQGLELARISVVAGDEPLRITSRMRVEELAQAIRVQLDALEIRQQRALWVGRNATVLRTEAGDLTIDNLVLRSGDALVSVDAHLPAGATIPARLEARVVGLKIRPLIRDNWPRGLPTEPSGTIEAALSLNRRNLTLDASVTDLLWHPQSPRIDGRLEARIDEKRTLVRMDARGDDLGVFELTAHGAAPRSFGSLASWKALPERLEGLSMKLESFDVAQATRLFGSDVPNRGQVDATVELTRGGRAGQLEAHWKNLQLLPFVIGAWDGNLEGAREPEALRFTATATDLHSGRIKAAARVRVPNAPLFFALRQVGAEDLRSLSVDTDRFDLAYLQRVDPALPRLRGSLELSAALDRNRQRFDLTGQVRDGRFEKWGGGISANLTLRSHPRETAIDFSAGGSTRRVVTVIARIAEGLPGLFATKPAWQRAALHGQLRVTPTALADLSKEWQLRPPLAGTLDVDVRVDGTVATPLLRGHARGKQLRFGGAPLPDVDATMRADRGTTRADVALAQRDGRATIEFERTAAGRVETTLVARRFALDFLNPILLEARVPASAITGALSGRVFARRQGQQTKLEGKLTMKQGTIGLPAPLGLLTDLAIDTTIANGQLVAHATARAQKGKVELEASSDLDGFIPKTGQVRIKTDNFPLLVRGATMRASSEIEVARKPMDDRFGLAVNVKKASVVMPKLPGGPPLHPTGPLPDVVFADRMLPGTAVERETPANEGMPISIDAQRVRVRGPQMNIIVKADVDVDGPTMKGQAGIDQGYVVIFDRRYEVLRAQAIFTGEDPPNPGVDLELSREFPDARVFIKVTGTVKNPDLTFRSEPGIYSQAEILSLIVNGVPSGGGDTDPESAAISALTGLLSKGLVEMVKGPMKVDTLTVGMGDREQGISSVTVGKWLTPELFIAYQRQFDANPEENQDEVHLEWWFSPRWIFEAKVGDAGAGSGDILWIIRF